MPVAFGGFGSAAVSQGSWDHNSALYLKGALFPFTSSLQVFKGV